MGALGHGWWRGGRAVATYSPPQLARDLRRQPHQRWAWCPGTRPGPRRPQGARMGAIRVHEFITLDGVFDNPAWTFDYPFDPRMGEAIAGIMGGSEAILLGRTTYDLFAPTWSTRTAADDPGAPFMNSTPKYV